MPNIINSTAFCCHSSVLALFSDAVFFQLNFSSRLRHRFLVSLFTKDIVFYCQLAKMTPFLQASYQFPFFFPVRLLSCMNRFFISCSYWL